ncbi:glycerol-3-phosphate acyltransferase [Metabacillus herbersteinensis]
MTSFKGFLTIIIILSLSYLIGSILFGYIVSSTLGNLDLRTEGSGNVGARNAGRLLGKKGLTYKIAATQEKEKIHKKRLTSHPG